MRQGINSLADCGMNLGSRSRCNLKTDRSAPSTLHIHIDLISCTNVNLGVIWGYLWGWAGLFNLSASFLTLGEPAPCIYRILDPGAISQILCTFPQSILHLILHQVCG
jgi:hypothetical protein